jgi:hypothetical protein
MRFCAKIYLRDSASAIISRAYEEAKGIFIAELAKDDFDRIWAQRTSTIEDVKVEALKLSKRYGSKSATKTRKWITRFSETVIYYGGVLDVLVQQYPEWVSLAWGTMKFLFSVSIQDRESCSNLTMKVCDQP